MLAGEGASTWFMYNGLKDTYNIQHVVIPGPNPGGMKKFLQRRVKRLGYWEVFGQVLFQGLCLKPLNFISKKRVAEIKDQLKLSDVKAKENVIINVPSVNSDVCLETLQKLDADIIIVNGTSIISKKILNGVRATFINTHVGITPKYRGVHGGYWALANNDNENCGVTVHLVDAGIDTGGILYQGVIETTKKDSFITYPYLQIAEGVTCMKKALHDALNDTLSPTTKDLESKLWYHPTIWRYLWTWMSKGVK